jgi:hypothetical protein
VVRAAPRSDESRCRRLALQSDGLAWHAEAELELGTDRHPLDPVAERVGEEVVKLVPAVVADLVPEQAGAHTDAERFRQRVHGTREGTLAALRRRRNRVLARELASTRVLRERWPSGARRSSMRRRRMQAKARSRRCHGEREQRRARRRSASDRDAVHANSSMSADVCGSKTGSRSRDLRHVKEMGGVEGRPVQSQTGAHGAVHD